MDLLEYGMKKEQSNSAAERVLARGALSVARKKADLYEAYISRQDIPVPDEEEARLLLQKILDQVSAEG